MKSLAFHMFDADYFTQDDETRFEIIEKIFDYIYLRVTVNEPRNLISPVCMDGLEQNVWFTAPGVARKHYDALFDYLREYGTLFTYLQEATGHDIIADSEAPVSGEWLSVGDILSQMTGEVYDYESIIEDTDENDVIPVSSLPTPEEYCMVMSQVLSKIVTDNVSAHGLLMLYFYGQFVRLGLVDYPQITP